MVNLPKPRKVDESKNLLRKATKTKPQVQVTATLPEILANFEASVCAKDGLLYLSDNHATSNAIRQLLSSLQALLKRNEIVTWNEEQFEEITSLAVKCLCILNRLVSDESAFPETITLSALCMSFLLLNYFTSFVDKFPSSNNPVWASFRIYISYFTGPGSLETTHLASSFTSIDIQGVHATATEVIRRMASETTISSLSFREAALLSGLLNCTFFHDLFATKMIDAFLHLHPLTIRFCSMSTVHEFHVVRLLNQYLKTLYDHRKTIQEYCNSKQQSYSQLIVKLVTETLAQIDNDWESPVSGVGNLIRQAYKTLIELIKEPMREEKHSEGGLRKLIVEQFQRTLSLPFTCKSKYRKLSTLLQVLASEDIGTSYFKSFNNESSTQTSAIKLCELPFLFGSEEGASNNFAQQVVHHLSINSLASGVAEFYKVSVGAICAAYKDDDAVTENEPTKVTQIWSKYWLTAITSIFSSSSSESSSSSLSKSGIVQNALMAHIFPCTLQSVPGSIPILMTAFSTHPFGQIAVVRIALEKCSVLVADRASLPPPSWLVSLLADSDDMTRAEALALLVDERFIGGVGSGNSKQAERPLVCRLLLRHFLRSNLNIDSAPFRQRVICRLEQFYFKVIISVVDRSKSTKRLQDLAGTDRAVVDFVKESLDLLALSLLPGSSYQRKFTALSVFSSIISTIGKEDSEGVFQTFFRQIEEEKKVETVCWRKMLLLGLVDKDDKIRRLSTEVLVEFGKSPLSQIKSNSINQLFESLYKLAVGSFLDSSRHQEAHIGGLLLKCLLRWPSHDPQSLDSGMKVITSLVESATSLFYSPSFQGNLLQSAKRTPLHGRILALNHCLTFITFYDSVIAKENQKTFCRSLLQKGSISTLLRNTVFQPSIKLALDALEFFLKLLTPANSKIEVGDGEEEQMDVCSPSFYEMCQSIEGIIKKENSANANSADVFLSNDFQLILSMCWLNMKECTFLLTTITALFADILSLILEEVGEDEDIINSQMIDDQDYTFLVSANELLAMGSKIVSVMLRCRHKGVIEASGVALSRFTRTVLRIQCLLSSPVILKLKDNKFADMKTVFAVSLESFVGQILSAIDFGAEVKSSTTTSSVTRRSAGLALIVQAVLVGEAEAIYLDGLRPIVGGGGEQTSSSTLYERVISLLVGIAKSQTFPANLTADNLQLVDLPQSNALHILHSIVGTSALSHYSAKTVETLFPLCISGFTSPHWQLRNASLTLFGACTIRMLGQRKRIKALESAAAGENSSSVEGDYLGAEFGTTITFAEFTSRYPTLVSVIKAQFESCSTGSEQLHPELVPVLSLLASFTALGDVVIEGEFSQNHQKLTSYLISFLSNRIWKVRMLAARSLANLWSVSQLEGFLFERLNLKKDQIMNGNLLHGLLCSADNLLHLKGRAFTSNLEVYRQKVEALFEVHIQGRTILKRIADSIFRKTSTPFDDDDDDEEVLPKETMTVEIAATFSDSVKALNQNLQSILENVNFKKSDDIRLRAALQLKDIVEVSLDQLTGLNLAVFVDVMLVLLEDEDRDVRMVGQTVVSKNLLKNSNQIFNQTVSLDGFFGWLLEHHSEDEQLFTSLFRRLVASSTFTDEQLDLFLRQDKLSGEDESEIVLFAREEKNVFAEPYVMAIRVAGYLQLVQAKHLPLPQSLLGSYDVKLPLLKSCTILGKIFSLGFAIQVDSLMCLSIWKLPDFFVRLISLWEVLELLEANCKLEEVEEMKITLQLIRKHFPYLATLQRHLLKSPDDDVLMSNKL